MNTVLRLLVCLFLSASCTIAVAQKMSIAYQNPANFFVCGTSEGSITLTNDGPTALTAIQLALSLPSGVEYVAGSATIVSEWNIANLNQPVFRVADMPAGAKINFQYRVTASCALIADINAGKTFSNKINATFSGGNVVENGLPYKIETALLLLGGVTPALANGGQGDVITRTLTVKNTREGSITSLNFKDVHTGGLVIELQGVSGTNTGNQLFQATVPGAYFKNFGNGNELFENGESITLTEKITITRCEPSATKVPSVISVGWGCNPVACQTETTQAEIEVKPNNNQPKLTFEGTLALPNEQCGDEPTTQELTIRNDGNAPTKGISLILISPDTFHLGMDGKSFEYNIGNGWTTLTQINGTSFNLQPCNKSTFQQASIQLPALLPGETLRLRFHTLFCAPLCYGKIPTLSGAYSYTKDCGSAPFINGSFAFSSPSAVKSIDSGVEYNFGGCMAKDGTYELRYWVKSLRQTIENGFLHVYLNLPQGLEWSDNCNPVLAGKTAVKKEITAGTTKSARQIVHLAYPLPFSVDSAAMKFCVTYSCVDTPACNNLDNFYISSGVGMTVYPTPQGCNGCDLTAEVFTGISKKLDIQQECLIGDCDNFTLIADLTNCPSIKKCKCNKKPQLKLIDAFFNTYRLNVGYKDDNNDRVADDQSITTSSKVRRDRFVTGDTMRLELRAVPEKGVHREVGFRFFVESWASDFGLDGGDPYELMSGKDVFVNKDHLKYLSGNLIFKIAATGKEYTCPIDKPSEQSDRHVFEIADPNQKPLQPEDKLISMYDEYLFNFYEIGKSGCIPDGFSVTENDSVIFIGDYRFDHNFLPISNAQPALVNFRTLAGSMDTPYGWKTDSTTVPLMRQYSGFLEKLVTPTFNLFPCKNAEQVTPLRYEMRIAKPNLFPFEVRSLSSISKLRQTFPGGIPLLSARLSQMSLQDNPILFSNVPITPGPAGVIDIQQFMKNSLDEGWNMQFDFELGFACKIQDGEPAATALNIHYWSNEFRKPNPAIIEVGNPNAYIDQSAKLQMLTKDSIVALNGNQFTIDFNIRNRVKYDGDHVWLVIDDGGTLSNIQLIDKSTGKVIPAVAGVYQMGSYSAFENKNFTINAIGSTCDVATVRFRFGWNCSPVTTPNSNLCNVIEKIIKIKPIPTELELRILNQPEKLSLCTTSDYIEFEVYNAKEGIALGVLANVQLPQGITIVPNSAQIAYPVGSAWLPINDPVAVNGILQWKPEDVVKALKDKGLTDINTAPNNSLVIRFKVEAGCGAVANAQIIYGTEAVQACGALSNTLRKPGLPLPIEGISADYKVNAALDFSTSPAFASCGQSVSLIARVNATNIPASGDSLYILLPAGVNYVSGSYQALQNAASGPPEVRGRVLQLPMPTQMGIGADIVFRFDLRYDDPASCDDKNVVLQARQRKTAACPGKPNCTVYVVSGEAMITLNTVNPDLLLRNFEPVPSGNGFTFNALLENAGAGASQGQVIKFYLDQNGNGKVDTGEPLVQEIKNSQTIAPGANGAINGPLGNLSSENLCKLIAVINGNENCACADRVFPLNFHTTVRSTVSSCEIVPLTFGTPAENGHVYEWVAASGLSCTQCSNVTFSPGAGVVAGDAFVFTLKDQSGSCTIERLFEVKYGIPESLNLPNQRVCKGQSVRIEAPKGGIYQWAGPGVKNESTISTQVLTPAASTAYQVTVTFVGGCSKTAEVLVTVLPSDTTKLPSLSTCKGNPKLVAGTLTDIEGIYYNKLSNYNGCDSIVVQQLLVKPTETAEGKGLCPSDTLQIFGKPVTKAGTYCETFKSTQGCDSTHCVTVSSVPGPKLTKPDSAIVELENSIQLNAAGGFAYYNWQPPTDLSCTDCPSPIAKPKETTNYVLKVKDQNGCEDEVTYRVVVFPPCDPARLLIPNAFTPNGDGVNDKFRVVPFEGIETVFSIQIYDRWGRKVFEKSGQKNIEWDGTVDGELGLPDVYVWQISISCPLSGEVTKQGGVALLR